MVAGAFFEVTGAFTELVRIERAIEQNDGRLTADSSATLDLWLEMREEWFKLHDAEVLKRAQQPAAALDGATNEPAPDTMIANAGEFAARWNTWEPEQREKVWQQIQSGVQGGQRCFLEDHDSLKKQYDVLYHRHGAIQMALDGLMSREYYQAKPHKAADDLDRLLERISVATRRAEAEAWTVEYLHQDCEKCEACAESGIIHAKVTGSTGATYQETEPVPYDRAGDITFTPKVAHSATVRRA